MVNKVFMIWLLLPHSLISFSNTYNEPRFFLTPVGGYSMPLHRPIPVSKILFCLVCALVNCSSFSKTELWHPLESLPWTLTLPYANPIHCTYLKTHLLCLSYKAVISFSTGIIFILCTFSTGLTYRPPFYYLTWEVADTVFKVTHGISMWTSTHFTSPHLLFILVWTPYLGWMIEQAIWTSEPVRFVLAQPLARYSRVLSLPQHPVPSSFLRI